MIGWNRNRVTEKLGIDYPIIQGPLGGLSSQRLSSLLEAVSEIVGPVVAWNARHRPK
jgi:NAD(P)H-dependent flavin oxidoreductase YrpB (nitropropane dioxygenase family)